VEWPANSRSQRESGGEELLLQFLRPAGWQPTCQKGADVSGPHLEQVGQGLGVVAMAGQARLQIIQIPRQHALDEFRGERFLPDLMPFLKRPGEVVLDLERGGQAVGEERERGEGVGVVPPVLQIAIDGAAFQEALGRADEPVWGLDAIVFQEPNRLRRRQVPSLLVRGPQLHRGDQLAVALELVLGQHAWGATIAAVHRLQRGAPLQGPVDGGFRDAIGRGRPADHLAPLSAARREHA
jgi:hypothetical protein